MIAEEMIGIDVDLLNDAAQTQLNDTPIVSRRASPPRFPSVHPFAVVGIFIRDKHAAPWLEQILLLGKELIVRQQNATTNALRSQIDKACGGRCLWISRA